MVTETDVTLAKASNAVLVAFNVKPSKEAKKLAEQEGIKISSYNIIYEVLDYIKKRLSGFTYSRCSRNSHWYCSDFRNIQSFRCW